MRPYSTDLRQRIVAAVERHDGSIRQLALRFGVNPSFITRLMKRHRLTGSVEPKPHGGGRRPAFDHEALRRLRRLVAEHPDATLPQLHQRLGGKGSVAAICRALRKLDITRKKKSLHAAERDRPEVRRARRSFRRRVKPIEPERLVFVDETGVTTSMTPAYGRAPRGQRIVASAPASWESTTVIAALGLEGVRAPLVVPGSSNGPTFLAYIERVLAPELRAGDVVLFDNLGSHLSPAVAEAIERAGARVLRLPPYSPDFNPIEEMFSKFKEALRRAGARTKEKVYEAVGQALKQMRRREIIGWFQDAGLCANQT
jgi:transposase